MSIWKPLFLYYLIWSLILGGSLIFDTHHHNDMARNLALSAARVSFNRDQAFRQWATSHGGVYVKPDAHTPPNPYLTHIPDRDVETTSGIKLTLMNPAYMVRQMMSDYAGIYGDRGRITSLKPLNPDNAPDPWETSALKAFERGVAEVEEFIDIKGEPYLRLIRPMAVTQGCIKCHGHQGYHVGDIRGGIGVNVPMKPFLSLKDEHNQVDYLSHGLLWVLGLGLITFFTRRRFVDVLERHQALESLKSTNAMLEKAQEIAHMGNWVRDFSLDSLAWSKELFQIFGLDPNQDAPSFKTFVECIHPDDRDAVIKTLTTSLEGLDNAFQMEYRIIRPDGTQRIVRASGNIERDKQSSTPRRTIGTVQDITEARQFTQILAEEKRRADLYLSVSGNLVVRLDTEARIVFINDAGLHILGYEKDDILGKKWIDLMIPHEHREEIKKVFKHLVSGHVTQFDRYENYLLAKDGSFRWILWNNLLERDGNQKITGLLSVGNDHSEIKENEDQLRRANKAVQDQQMLFRSILDKSLDAIITIDREGMVVDFNPSAETMFGYSKQEILGKNLVDAIIPEEFKERHNAALKKRRFSNPVLSDLGKRIEMPGLRKDGMRIDLEMTLSRVTMNDDVFYTGFIHDVTEKRQLLQSLRDTLDVAEVANRAKSEFLANMSHEIRSPMNAIIGMTDLVLDTELTEDQRDNLDIVQNSASNLLEIINNILDFSKIEAGRVTLEQIPFDLHSQVEKVCETLAIQAHKKGVELFCDIQPAIPEVVGDSHRLYQILINLINNAIKFTSQGEIVVRVAYNSEEPNCGETVQVHIGVVDTGIGIPITRIDQLFEPFTQADSSTTRKYGGTGLGLTISKRLVWLMDGKIWVESEPDKGSTFHVLISFPISQRDRLETKPSVARGSQQPGPDHFSGIQILIGGSTETGRSILKKILTHFGARTQEAVDVPSIIKSLEFSRKEGQPFQIIILDEVLLTNELPESGHFWQRLGADENILILTSTDPTQAHLTANPGFQKTARLKKPVRFSSLVKKIDLLLGRKTEEEKRAVIAPSLIPSRTNPMRILVVEDLVNNQKLATRILEKAGHSVTLAEHGGVALERLAENSFDLILMDLHMAPMDGYETTKRIREGETFASRNQRIPIVAVTARTMQEEEEGCRAVGMDGYVRKPYRVDELLQAIAPLAENLRRQQNVDNHQKESQVLFSVAIDPATFETIRKDFLDNGPDHRQRLGQFLQAREIKPALAEIKWVQETAAKIGANRLKILATRIKGVTEVKSWDETAQQFGNLDQEFQRVMAALSRKG